MTVYRRDKSDKLRKNVIIIGKFNLSDYNNFLDYSREGKLYFFHASTTWFIKDKRIRRYLLRPGDFIEQEELDKIEEGSMEFVRELEKSSKSVEYEGICLLPLLRYWNFRRHSMLLESYIALSECIKKYEPEMVVIDASCYNSRGKIYKAVAGCLLEKEKVPCNLTDSNSVGAGFNRLQYIRCFIKEQTRAIISLVTNSFCHSNGRRKTIVFSGSFNQMSQAMKWLADSRVYNIVYLKRGIPLNKVLFFLKNRITWQYIPSLTTKSKYYKNTLLNDFRTDWLKSGGVVNRFFRGEDILSGLMVQFINEDIEQNCVIITNLIRISDKISRRTNISAVIMDEDATLQNRIIVDTANHNNKETFVFCHGILTGRTAFVYSAKNILTYGKKISRQIKKYANEHQSNIYEIGTPRLERLKRLNTSESKLKIQRDFSISKNMKIILFPLGDLFFDKEYYTYRLKEETHMVISKTAKRLTDLVKKNKDLFLIIKLRNTNREKEFISDTYNISDSNRIKITGIYDVDYLVSGCDLIINTISTVSYHGLVVKKPVIRIKPKIDNLLWEFTDTDAERTVRFDSPMFEKEIMGLLYEGQNQKRFHQKAHQYLLENYCNEDLRVRERFLNTIHKILN